MSCSADAVFLNVLMSVAIFDSRHCVGGQVRAISWAKVCMFS